MAFTEQAKEQAELETKPHGTTAKNISPSPPKNGDITNKWVNKQVDLIQPFSDHYFTDHYYCRFTESGADRLPLELQQRTSRKFFSRKFFSITKCESNIVEERLP